MRGTPFSAKELAKLVLDGGPDQFGNDGNDLIGALAQEVEYLREWLAYCARAVEAQSLDAKSLSKGRRGYLRSTVIRMRKLALGEVVGHPRYFRSAHFSELSKLQELGEATAYDIEDAPATPIEELKD